MKFIAPTLLFTILFFACKQYSITESSKNTEMVSFTTVFKNEFATKDGYYLGGYVVVIEDDLAETLEGKTIKITGKYHIVKGIEEQPNKNGEFSQGRVGDTKHIANPTIEILEK